MRCLLIGGGRDPEGARAAHRPVLEAAAGRPIAVLVLDEGDGVDAGRWGAQLAGGEVDVLALRVGSPVPDVAGAAVVYVAGGWTPGYADALRGWRPPASVEAYAGFSAGAAVAARWALVGGWRAEVGGTEVAVCPEEAGEGLGRVEVRPGLGLVEPLVDVHAAQWGTLGRLAAALRLPGAPDEGWALDEHACLDVPADGGPPRVHGTGAIHVLRDGRLRVAGPGARVV